MYDIQMIKQILQGMGVNPHRLRGQNFLIDPSVVERILDAAALSSEDAVLEIGPGLGALSQRLAACSGRLLLLEIECAFAERLKDIFAFEPQVEVCCLDALTFDYEAYCREHNISSYHLVANLPYNITTSLLQHFLLAGGPWKRATLMLQREAAQRICSGPGRENGPLSLLTQYCADARLLFVVPPESFYPAPAVHSAVIQLSRRETPSVDVDLEPLMALVEAAFSQRRKQLANTLSGAYQRQDGMRFSREQITAALLACDLSPSIRAEQMDLPAFAALLKHLQAK